MKQKRWIVIICIGALLALVLAFFLYRGALLPGERRVSKEQTGIVPEVPEERAEVVKKKIEPLSPKEEPPPPAVAEVERDFLQERVKRIFASLDEQEYIRAYHLKGGSYRHFLEIASKLSSRPPVASGEMEDLLILRSNMAHLFRVLGRSDVSLVLDVLSHEETEIEDAMGVLYEWGMREAQQQGGAIGADMEDLYEYAAFFLNTLSGKMYLLRRSSQVRILLTYYSILMLDRANTERLNRHGVDIRPHVNRLIDDIERYEGLDYRDRYLERLYVIRG